MLFLYLSEDLSPYWVCLANYGVSEIRKCTLLSSSLKRSWLPELYRESL